MNDDDITQQIRKYLDQYLTEPNSTEDDTFIKFGSAGVEQLFHYGVDLIKNGEADFDKIRLLTRLFDVVIYSGMADDAAIDGVIAGCREKSHELSELLRMFSYGSRNSLSFLLVCEMLEYGRSIPDELLFYLIEHDPWIASGQLNLEPICKFLRVRSSAAELSTRSAALQCAMRLSVPQCMPFLVELISNRMERQQIDGEEFHILLEVLLYSLWWPHKRMEYYAFVDGLKPVLERLQALPIVSYSARRMKAELDDPGRRKLGINGSFEYKWQEVDIVGPDGRAMMLDANQPDYRKLHAWVDRCFENDDLELRLPDFIRVVVNAGHENNRVNAARFLAELDLSILKRRPAGSESEPSGISIHDLKRVVWAQMLSMSTDSDRTRIRDAPAHFVDKVPILVSKLGLAVLGDMQAESTSEVLHEEIEAIREEVIQRLEAR